MRAKKPVALMDDGGSAIPLSLSLNDDRLAFDDDDVLLMHPNASMNALVARSQTMCIVVME